MVSYFWRYTNVAIDRFNTLILTLYMLSLGEHTAIYLIICLPMNTQYFPLMVYYK